MAVYHFSHHPPPTRDKELEKRRTEMAIKMAEEQRKREMDGSKREIVKQAKDDVKKEIVTENDKLKDEENRLMAELRQQEIDDKKMSIMNEREKKEYERQRVKEQREQQEIDEKRVKEERMRRMIEERQLGIDEAKVKQADLRWGILSGGFGWKSGILVKKWVFGEKKRFKKNSKIIKN